jgi:hypothetical protein
LQSRFTAPVPRARLERVHGRVLASRISFSNTVLRKGVR